MSCSTTRNVFAAVLISGALAFLTAGCPQTTEPGGGPQGPDGNEGPPGSLGDEGDEQSQLELPPLGGGEQPVLFRLPLAEDSPAHWYFDHDPSGGTLDWDCGQQTYDGHRGTDYSRIARGTPVYAAADGYLAEKDDGHPDGHPNYWRPNGNFVRLDHGSDGQGRRIRTVYLHFEAGSVTTKPAGSFIQCGEQIGTVGMSGRATGVHLHFEAQFVTDAGEKTPFDPYAGACGSPTSWWFNQQSGAPAANCQMRAGDDPCVVPDTLSAVEVADYAHRAGFSGGALVQAVAIAWAESWFKVSARNPGDPPGSEDSCGLWQINVQVHDYDSCLLLGDPQSNARAAFELSGGGFWWCPWCALGTWDYLACLSGGADYPDPLDARNASARVDSSVIRAVADRVAAIGEVNVRTQPGGTVLRSVPAGSLGTVCEVPPGTLGRVVQEFVVAAAPEGDPDRCDSHCDGRGTAQYRLWWRVEWDHGVVGWSAGEFLERFDGSPPPPTAPTITTSSPLPDGTVNTSYGLVLQATVGSTPYSWSVVSGDLPPGLALDSSAGTISGTPTTANSYDFTVRVTGANGLYSQKAFSLTISATPTAPTITTNSPLPDGTVNVSYSQTLQATGGMTPYSWSVVSGDLPPGLALGSSLGTIIGTPTTASSYDFTVRVTGANDPYSQKAFRLTVNATPTAPTWVLAATGDPGSELLHAMAWDLTRRRVVLHGSGAGNHCAWEWDGSQWISMGQCYYYETWPGARHGHALANGFAAGLGSGILLFGGGWVEDLNDTWFWDGASWQQLEPSASPPARGNHAMVWDDTRGRIVLFGGRNANGTAYLADTWEFDGSSWHQRFPPSSPPARAHHAMAFDETRGVTVLFGGDKDPVNNGQYYADTWEWDGTTWTERTLDGGPDGPSRRHSHAMAFDPARQVVVLFGGQGEGGQPPSYYLNDTWEWDGFQWHEVSTASQPGARAYHAMAWDGTSQKIILQGGADGGPDNETWLYGPDQ